MFATSQHSPSINKNRARDIELKVCMMEVKKEKQRFTIAGNHPDIRR
jgi:hypothetical protein